MMSYWCEIKSEKSLNIFFVKYIEKYYFILILFYSTLKINVENDAPKSWATIKYSEFTSSISYLIDTASFIMLHNLNA